MEQMQARLRAGPATALSGALALRTAAERSFRAIVVTRAALHAYLRIVATGGAEQPSGARADAGDAANHVLTVGIDAQPRPHAALIVALQPAAAHDGPPGHGT